MLAKYREAFSTGLTALRAAGGGGGALALPLLPHIYGSAEYLNDSEAGLGARAQDTGPGSAAQEAAERGSSQPPSEAGLLAAAEPEGSLPASSEYYNSDEYDEGAESTVGSMMGPGHVRTAASARCARSQHAGPAMQCPVPSP